MAFKGPFEDFFDGPLGSGSTFAKEDSTAKLSESVLRIRLKEAEQKIGKLEADKLRLMRMGQNNIDRAWNKALNTVVAEPAELQLGFEQVDRIKEMRRIVRHQDEFGSKA